MPPYEPCHGYDHTTHSWWQRELQSDLAAAAAKIKRGGDVLGKNWGGKPLLAFLCIIDYSVLFFALFCKCHSSNRMSIPPAVVAWDLLFLPTALYLEGHSFLFLSFHSCLAVLWLLPKYEMKSIAFPSDNLGGKGKALLLCGFLQFEGLMHQELAEES